MDGFWNPSSKKRGCPPSPFPPSNPPFISTLLKTLFELGGRPRALAHRRRNQIILAPPPSSHTFPSKLHRSPPPLPSLFPYPFPLCCGGGSDLFFSGNPRSQKERWEPGVNRRRGSRENGLSVRPPPSADRQPVRGWMDLFPPPLILLSLLLIILPSRAQALLVLLPTLFQVWLFIKVFFIQSSPAIETANRSSNSPQSIGIVFERGRHPHRHPNRGAVAGSLR